MKNTKLLQLFLYLCIIVLSISSCEEEPTEQKEQPVQFSFSSEELAENGRLADLSDARAIVISIKNSSGETVLSMERIDVYKLPGSGGSQKFVSKPVSLKPGDYELTDFLVVDENNNVIYVTPKEGSDNSHLVYDPLPIQFSVTANSINEFSVQVVDATTEPVESYGYTTFALYEVNTLKFRIQPFIVEYELSAYEYTPHLALTEAHIEVRRSFSTDIIFEGTISPGNNLVEIPVGYGKYDVKITKEFYEPYEKTFTSEELIAMQGDPIEVMLENQAEFIPILSTEETVVSLLIPPGDHSKLLYTTSNGLYKVDISDLHNPGDPVLVAGYTGWLSVNFFGNIRLGDYVSTDQGETWNFNPQTGPRTFAKIDGTYYGRIGSELYGRSGSGDWQLLSELAPYTDIVAYQDRLYTAPGNVYEDGFYVTEDGINFQEIPANNVMDVDNDLFTGAGKLFLDTSHEGLGFIVLWDGSSWTVDNTIHEYDPEINNPFYVEAYKNNLIVVENDRVKVIQLNNCSPGACEAQLLATYVSEYVFHAFSTIHGSHLTGDILLLKTVADKDGKTHLYAMDLSGLELE